MTEQPGRRWRTAMENLWYVAQLKPNGERLAEENLVRQGFDVFAPTLRKTTPRKDRFRDELRPLFPGYLFVRSPAQAACWRAIGGTLGIRKLVSFGEGRPSAVPAGIIEWLREHFSHTDPVASDLRKGDLVRVISGPFCDLLARVEALPGRERIYVLLDVMGKERRVSITRKSLLPQLG